MNPEKARILVIDDDPDFVRTTGLVLKSAGYEVLEAFSGKEGLEKAKAEKPDLFLIDLMMESYSEGSNLAQVLAESKETRGKPRIMITSVDLRGPYESLPAQEMVGCDVVLQKPVSPKDLLEKVKRALEGK